MVAPRTVAGCRRRLSRRRLCVRAGAARPGRELCTRPSVSRGPAESRGTPSASIPSCLPSSLSFGLSHYSGLRCRAASLRRAHDTAGPAPRCCFEKHSVLSPPATLETVFAGAVGGGTPKTKPASPPGLRSSGQRRRRTGRRTGRGTGSRPSSSAHERPCRVDLLKGPLTFLCFVCFWQKIT